MVLVFKLWRKKSKIFRNIIINIIIIIFFTQKLLGVFYCFFKSNNFLLIISIQCNVNVQCKFITKCSIFSGLPSKYSETTNTIKI